MVPSSAHMWEESLVETNLKNQSQDLGLRIPSLKPKADAVYLCFILVISTAIIFVSFKLRIFHLWFDFLKNNPSLRTFFYPVALSGLFVIAGIVFRTLLWFRYRPLAVQEGENVSWPFVSVIMSAFNEEELIEESIDSVFSCEYPAEMLEVICINDGSTDATLSRMIEAKRKYGKRLKIINFPTNLGKRKAVYIGLKEAKGSLVITADTDSKIDKAAIKNVILPLLKDPQTGAVSGRVEVLNEKENFLTRMLAVRYSISFNFGRAYQSVYGAVFCCPGALTAYRKDILLNFIHDWLDQKFLNTQCTYGEDRALTTQILRAGFRTKFQSNAVVFTKVPSRFIQMNKMYLRWTRSYIRESIIFAGFMFTNYRSKQRILPILDFFFLNFLHPFHIFSLGFVAYSFTVHPLFVLRHLTVILIFAFVLSLYFLREKKSLDFLYGIPYGLITAFCLWWIVPFAACTIKNQSWMTR